MKQNEKQKEFKAENLDYNNKKEGEMATIKEITNFLIWLSVGLVIVGGIRFFYQDLLFTFVFLILGGLLYVFKKDIAKIIKRIIG